jgi:uncharacterized protein YkwD
VGHLKRITGVLILGLFIPGCFATLPESPAAVGAGKVADCITPEDPERLADQVLQLVNLERADADLPPVVRNAVLDKVADDYACRMIADDFFDHFDPVTGYGPGDRAVAGKYSFFAIGENLAAGQETPGEVMKVWMESPPHRAIILDEKWTEIGLSVRLGGEYDIYWVQEFGAPADY